MTEKWNNFVHRAFWALVCAVCGFIVYTGVDMQKSLIEIKVMVSGFSEIKTDVKELKSIVNDHEIRIQKMEP